MSISRDTHTDVQASRFRPLLIIVTQFLYVLVIFKYLLYYLTVDASVEEHVCLMSKLGGEHSSQLFERLKDKCEV